MTDTTTETPTMPPPGVIDGSGTVRAITPIGGTYQRIVKPVIDRVVAAALLVLLSPIMLLAAVAVAISLGRPVFFKQRRVGLGGATFEVIKFRTMAPDRRTSTFRRVNADRRAPERVAAAIAAGQERRTRQDRRRTHKSPDDPRLHPVGEFLRKWSIDELPQLFNVLRGEMSLVGPRPELVDIVARKYHEQTHLRHVVKPGITGLWQISARGDGLMFEHPELDLEYVRTQSFLLDMKILLRTPIAAATGSKGY